MPNVDLGYLALYEDLIPGVNKSAARPTAPRYLKAAPDPVQSLVPAATTQSTPAPTVPASELEPTPSMSVMQELEPETELPQEERG